MNMKTIAALALLAPMWAFATTPPPSSGDQEQNQGQLQAQGQHMGQAQGMAQGQTSDNTNVNVNTSGSTSTATGGSATSTSGAGGDGGNAVSGDTSAASDSTSNSVGTGQGGNAGGQAASFDSNYDSMAISLPGHAMAAEVVTNCTVSRGSLGALGIGSGGKVKIDDSCAKRLHCYAIADRYAHYNRIDLAIAQLQSCDGVKISEGDAPKPGRYEQISPPVPGERCDERQDRIFAECQSK